MWSKFPELRRQLPGSSPLHTSYPGHGGMVKSTGTSLKTPPDFVLLFTISGFRTLWDLHGVRLSILTERRPAPRRACLLCGLAAPLEYTSSPFTSTLTSEPSKGHQTPPGARHLLNPCSLALFLNQKTSSPLSPPAHFLPPPSLSKNLKL